MGFTLFFTRVILGISTSAPPKESGEFSAGFPPGISSDVLSVISSSYLLKILL